MQIQPYLPSPIYSLPDEDLIKCFSYLSLYDLPIVACVCKIWEQVSSDEHLWKPIAWERLTYLPLNELSTKTKVLNSIAPFCRATRLVFKNDLVDTPSAPSPLIELKLIETQLKTISKAEPFCLSQPNLDISEVIDKHIPQYQASLYRKKEFIDATFECLIRSSTHLEVTHINLINDLWKGLTPQCVERMNNMMHIGSLLSEYLSIYVKKPLATSIFYLCSGHVFIFWMETLAKTLDARIQYPEFIHGLIKKLEETEFLALFETSNFKKPVRVFADMNISLDPKIFDPASLTYQNYQTAFVLESYKNSLLAIRKS